MSDFLSGLSTELRVAIVELLVQSGDHRALRSWSCTCSSYRSLLIPDIFKSVSLHDAESKNLEIDAADNDDADQDDSDQDGFEKDDSELDDVIREERAREVKLMLAENPKRRTFPYAYLDDEYGMIFDDENKNLESIMY